VDIEQALKKEKIRNLSTSQVVLVGPQETLSDVLSKMQKAEASCAVIANESKKILGIFTERDALHRTLLTKASPTAPIQDFMTKAPKVLKGSDSVALAIRFMTEGKYRHLPIVNDKEEFEGLFSVRDVVAYLSEIYPLDICNQPPDPHQVARTPEGA